MRRACVDIGTNTTRLLVADRVPGGLRTVAVARAFVPLGAGTLASRPAADTRAALVAAVTAHLATAREHGARSIRVVGTAALRTDGDADGLCAALREAAGTDVEILPPREEARLAFLGATGTLADPPLHDGDVAVVDVGGGSTEIAVGPVGGAVGWWTSIATGSAVLTNAHVRGDPPAAPELAALTAAAGAAVGAVAPPRPVVAYAVGGSAASLPRIVGPRVTAQAAERAVALLTAAPAERIAAEHGLDVRRVRMLPAGILLLAAVGRALGCDPVVARGGLREGVVLDDGSHQVAEA